MNFGIERRFQHHYVAVNCIDTVNYREKSLKTLSHEVDIVMGELTRKVHKCNINGVIRNQKSKDMPYNGQKQKGKRTNYVIHKTTQKTKE